MVAYSFKERFAGLVEIGAKTQTIRGQRDRHARVGEQVQLYTGMRTSKCRLLARGECIDVAPVRIVYGADGFVRIGADEGVQEECRGKARDTFAKADGFKDWDEMRDWFQDQYGGPFFDGVLIRWRLPAEQDAKERADRAPIQEEK